MSPTISIVLPTYNERENIVRLVDQIHAELSLYPHEILVMDDNSPDGTCEMLWQKNADYLRAIKRTGPRGFAFSIRDGIERSKGEIIIIMDSDFNHQPKYLPFMIEALRYNDCVSGSRFLYGGGMEGWFRHKFSWLFNIFTRLLTAGSITDSLYGFIAIRRGTLFNCDFDKIFWGYGDYCIRLMFHLQKRNVSILQFPAINGRRQFGEANTKLFSVLMQYTGEVLRLVWTERLLAYVYRNQTLPDLRQQQSD